MDVWWTRLLTLLPVPQQHPLPPGPTLLRVRPMPSARIETAPPDWSLIVNMLFCTTANDPANDPALNKSGNETEAQAAHRANPGASILSNEQASKLEQPLSKEEIARRAAELNK